MTDLHRQIMEICAEYFPKFINDIFDGLVTFEFDIYFTTQVLGNESFRYGIESNGKYNYRIFANDIKELNGMLNNYGSIITTFNMNDYEAVVHEGGGGAIKKYAYVYMESLFKTLIYSNIPEDEWLDNQHLKHILQMFAEGSLHEFTHTVELYHPYGDIYDYHQAGIYCSSQGIKHLDSTIMYLLNKAVVDGQTVGIPYSFWQQHNAKK